MDITASLLAILILNGLISWWNAYAVGSVWAESRLMGGGIRFLAWCGAIQSAIGFSTIWFVVVGKFAADFGILPTAGVKLFASIFYLLIIVPALGTGLAITIHGWIAWYREGGLLNLGTNVWNTYTMIHNASQAYSGIGQALEIVTKAVGEAFSSDDDDSTALALLVIALLLTALALALGGFMTFALIKRYEGRLPLPDTRRAAA